MAPRDPLDLAADAVLAAGVQNGNHPQPPEFGDLLVADRFVAEHGRDYLHVFGLGWHRWTGSAWRPCELGEHVEAVKDVTRALVGAPDVELPDQKGAMRASRVSGALKLAESDPTVALAAERLDADPFLLATPGGVVELGTGKLREAVRSDLVSLLTKVSPAGAVGPLWTAFLERVQPDPVRRRMLQRLTGLGAVGRVEHVLALMIGQGANGKSTFKECVRGVLDEYAHTSSLGLLMSSRHEAGRPSPEVAGLRGKRWVEVSESPEDAALSVERTKWLTGGDRLTARHLYSSPITFMPTHTIALISNHLPRVADDGLAIWRRLLLIRWDVVIPEHEQDKQLGERIMAEEAGGVLRWIIDGAVDYLRDGLAVPECIRADTESYRAAEDVFGTWLGEKTEEHSAAIGRAGQLMTSYRAWAASTGAPPLTDAAMRERLEARGFRREVRSDRVTWVGIRLRTEDLEAP